MALGLVSGGGSELAGEASTSINTLCFEKLREPRIWGWKLILRSLLLMRRLESLGISLRDNGNVMKRVLCDKNLSAGQNLDHPLRISILRQAIRWMANMPHSVE